MNAINVEMYRHLFEQSPVGMYIASEDKQVMVCNRGLSALFGIADQEAGEQRKMLEALLESFSSFTSGRRITMEEQPVKRNVEVTTVQKYGAPVVYRHTRTPIFSQDSRNIEYYGAFIESVTVNHAVLNFDTLVGNFQSILDSLYDALVLLNLDGTIVFANKMAMHLFGSNRAQLMDGTIFDVIPSIDIKKNSLRQIWKNAQSGREQFFQIELRRLDTGSTFKAEVYVRKVLQNGEEYLFANVRDITERMLINEKLRQNIEHLRRLINDIIGTISHTIEMRDPFTAGHQKQVADLAVKIGEEMGLPPDVLEGIRFAATIHDIGKISVPSEILSKPGELNIDEYNLVKRHPLIGNEIMKNIDFPWPISNIILQHHERLDGSGYPYGLQGDEICIEAKIVAVADVVTSMVSHRPYRPALGLSSAIDEINGYRDILYDPKIVDACMTIIKRNRPLISESASGKGAVIDRN